MWIIQKSFSRLSFLSASQELNVNEVTNSVSTCGFGEALLCQQGGQLSLLSWHVQGSVQEGNSRLRPFWRIGLFKQIRARGQNTSLAGYQRFDGKDRRRAYFIVPLSADCPHTLEHPENLRCLPRLKARNLAINIVLLMVYYPKRANGRKKLCGSGEHNNGVVIVK